jgi:hypothetical protein
MYTIGELINKCLATFNSIDVVRSLDGAHADFASGSRKPARNFSAQNQICSGYLGRIPGTWRFLLS